MLEPNWNQKKPRGIEIEHLWRIVKFLPIQLHNKRIDTILTMLEDMLVNGGCIFLSFEITKNLSLDWFASRNRLEEIDFVKKFLTANEVLSKLPEFSTVHKHRLGKIKTINPFVFDGELAAILFSGGVYEHFTGTSKQAKELARTFCEELFGERYTEIIVFKSNVAWSTWFSEFALDGTFILVDKAMRRVHLLCYTDVD